LFTYAQFFADSVYAFVCCDSVGQKAFSLRFGFTQNLMDYVLDARAGRSRKPVGKSARFLLLLLEVEC